MCTEDTPPKKDFFKTMFATNHKGRTPPELVGKIFLKTTKAKQGDTEVITKYPFDFYAAETINTSEPEPNEDSSVTDPAREVRIIMPMGGVNSGMFRQPHVGEKILVGETADGGLFLIGFVPDDQTSFVTEIVNKKKPNDKPIGIDENNAQVFRYKNNGDCYSEYEHSEIGFYSKQFVRQKKIEKGDNAGETDEKSDPVTITHDEIDIVSTGDIKNSASGCYGILADEFTLGVGSGNASIKIDGSGNIAIKAANSIKLAVGRTSVSISDTGFSVNSKITDTPIENTYDASISLKPLKGFSASGLNCSLSAVKEASICDGMGGKISSDTGVVSIAGREINLSNYSNVEFFFLTTFGVFEYVFNTIALSQGMAYRDKDDDDRPTDRRWEEIIAFRIHVAKYIRDILKDLYDLIKAGVKWRASVKKAEENEETLRKDAKPDKIKEYTNAAVELAKADEKTKWMAANPSGTEAEFESHWSSMEKSVTNDKQTEIERNMNDTTSDIYMKFKQEVIEAEIQRWNDRWKDFQLTKLFKDFTFQK